MTVQLKQQLFKDYLRERRDAHIEAVESNVRNDVYTIAEAMPTLTNEQIAYSIYQQYKVSKVIGGVKIGNSLFIRNKDLMFVTYQYLHDEIQAVMNEIDINETTNRLEEVMI
ncbi:hypothetical protein [Staphylococcus aureus]|uniref:hypothetical protein n=1 Tax=Staphylococcus aureus TaxID=1280 RepID=UPI001247140A|nr:hypothetical protein [Staphylococcus aureus]